jgi:glyoxylase-like metal-dependent hydrolase (beta-lactamase superfamily II)
MPAAPGKKWRQYPIEAMRREMREYLRNRAYMLAVFLLWIIGAGLNARAAESRFEKLSEHCYALQVGSGVAAVVTEDGVLLVNPPDEPGVTAVVDALRRLTQKPVRWMVATDYRFALSKGAAYFGEHGAVLLTSKEQAEVLSSLPGENSTSAAADRLIFGRQMHLFPSGVEVRIFGVRKRAHTGGDVVVFVPSDKVVVVGDLYAAGSYPDIDIDPGRGDALGWIEGMKEVIDSIPLLKPAITQPKPEIKPEEEKTLEQQVLVFSSYGAPSDLQQMKDLLSASRKLREQIARIVAMRRPCGSFLSSTEAVEFQTYGNLENYVNALCTALSGPSQIQIR